MPELDPTRVISGFRPTNDLTIGNHLGAVQPSVEIQNDPQNDLYVFVADLHSLTDSDARDIGPYRKGVVRDCMALGIDATRTTVFLQSDISAEVCEVAYRIASRISVKEIMRTPTLKEKMEAAVRRHEVEDDDVLQANLALIEYPALMAADIYAQQAPLVAVGEDQEPHLELARRIASRFNKMYETDILIEPKILATESLRILSLDGKSKMSKTNPNQALLLSDTPQEARKKIRRATTAGIGEFSGTPLESHFLVAMRTAQTEAQRTELTALRQAHEVDGRPVMGDFKELWGNITEELLVDFQQRRANITDAEVEKVLREGAEKARVNAQFVLNTMVEAMSF